MLDHLGLGTWKVFQLRSFVQYRSCRIATVKCADHIDGDRDGNF